MLKQKLRDLFIVQTIKHTLDFLGAWPILIGIVIAVSGTAWTWLSAAPLQILGLTSFSTIVAAIYVALLPRLIQTLYATTVYDRPDVTIWSRANTLRLYQAACLLADVEPRNPVPTPARGYLHLLLSAARDGQLKIEAGLVNPAS